MKRRYIAVAAVLLLVSGTTFAFPPRWHRRPRIVSGPVLSWYGFGHHHEPRWTGQYVEYCPRPPEYVPDCRWMPPREREREHYGWGWYFGWEYRGHGDWSQYREHRGWDPDHGEHRGGEGGGHDGRGHYGGRGHR
jgi:hypothetical protein